MLKKLVGISLAAVMAASLIACESDKTPSSSTAELTNEAMISSLESIADELELQMKESDPDVDVTLVIAEDGSCKLVAVSKEETEDVELELNAAKSVEDMFAAYQEAGFLSGTGEVFGFPESPKVEENEPTKSVPTESFANQEEVLDTTGLNNESGQIAGFPGQGTIDVGDVEVDISESESAPESLSVVTE